MVFLASKEDAETCIPFINITFLHNGQENDKQGRMPLTEDEMKALRLLLREELQAELRPFRDDMSKRFDEVATQMNGLYQRDEKRAGIPVYSGTDPTPRSQFA